MEPLTMPDVDATELRRQARAARHVAAFHASGYIETAGDWVDLVTVTPSTREGVDYQITRWEIRDDCVGREPVGHTDIVGPLAKAVSELWWQEKRS